MKFTTVFLALLMSFASVAFGQQPGQPRGYYDLADKVEDYALMHVQQEGNFYFLPFPNRPIPLRVPGFSSGEFYDGQRRAEEAQAVLRVLARFEEARGMEVVSFQLIRDQEARGATPTFHGIFLKAKPCPNPKK